jgi:UDP-N-acetylmuramyl pentapeptide phosphotransferase/UDP-N-acetylglucosamine-1-phosphate transferase
MSNELGSVSAATIATIAILSAVMSAVLILLLIPWLSRYAIVPPNARSSHTTPTPQGGGIAVVMATIVTVCGALYFLSGIAAVPQALPIVFAAVIFIAGLGAVDDISSIAVAPRLLLQTLAVTLVIYTLPNELRVVPFVPWWAERILLVVGGVWFVNLVNFMDGLDWMTVAEVVPITAALAVIGWLGALPPPGVIVALALCGATIGFAYFNRPVAKLFLGDVGSLPIGLLVGWLLLLAATGGHLAAAIVLPLYYLADATVTLLRRLIREEPIWQAHRMHFYQLATDHGFTVIQVVGLVFVVNVGLSALAVLTVIVPGKLTDAAALLNGAILVTFLLFAFAHGRK